MTHSNDPNCPLCNGANYRPDYKRHEYVKCDHSYIMYGDRVIATGRAAFVIVNVSLIVSVVIVGFAIFGAIKFIQLML